MYRRYQKSKVVLCRKQDNRRIAFINYAKKHDFDIAIVRYYNIYGPKMGYEHVIPEFLLRMYKKIDPFPIYGNTSRVFCYIDDAIEATELVMKNKNWIFIFCFLFFS